jgi:hypothetical protein
MSDKLIEKCFACGGAISKSDFCVSCGTKHPSILSNNWTPEKEPTMTENNERTPERWDFYALKGENHGPGSWHRIVGVFRSSQTNKMRVKTKPCAGEIYGQGSPTERNHYLFDLDDFTKRNEFLGNALKSVELCAGLGGDPAAAIAELREQLSKVTSDLRRWIQMAKFQITALDGNHPACPNAIGIKTSEQLVGKVAEPEPCSPEFCLNDEPIADILGRIEKFKDSEMRFDEILNRVLDPIDNEGSEVVRFEQGKRRIGELQETEKRISGLEAEKERMRDGWRHEKRNYDELRHALKKAELATQYLNGVLLVFPAEENHPWLLYEAAEQRHAALVKALRKLAKHWRVYNGAEAGNHIWLQCAERVESILTTHPAPERPAEPAVQNTTGFTCPNCGFDSERKLNECPNCRNLERSGLDPKACPACQGDGIGIIDVDEKTVRCDFCNNTGFSPEKVQYPGAELAQAGALWGAGCH